MLRHETMSDVWPEALVGHRPSGWAVLVSSYPGARGPYRRRAHLLSTPAGEVWRHLWRTQLVELLTNTGRLLAGVGGGR